MDKKKEIDELLKLIQERAMEIYKLSWANKMDIDQIEKLEASNKRGYSDENNKN